MGVQSFDKDALLSKKQDDDNSGHKVGRGEVFGWISAAIVFNVMNVVVYATLFQKIFQEMDPRFAVDFPTVSAISTLVSSLLLPPLGSLFDELKAVKSFMVVFSLVGVGLSFFLVLLPRYPGRVGILIAELTYFCAMFCLRLMVMNDNALLGYFVKSRRVMLSLLNNFVGFGVTLGLLALIYVTDKYLDVSATTWVGFCCVVGLAASICAMMAPADPPRRGPILIRQSVKESAVNMSKSFRELKTSKELQKLWIYLISYLLFSTGGTVFTILMANVFLDLYGVSLSEVVMLQLVYMSAMIFGVIIGIVYENGSVSGNRLRRDIHTLILQNIGFIIAFCFFIYVVPKDEFSLITGFGKALTISLVIGCLYGWNASVARGVMAKLTPEDKKCELMGFYSTFTYAGIAVASAVYSLVRSRGVLPWSLPLVLILFMIPSLPMLKKLDVLEKESDRRR